MYTFVQACESLCFLLAQADLFLQQMDRMNACLDGDTPFPVEFVLLVFSLHHNLLSVVEAPDENIQIHVLWTLTLNIETKILSKYFISDALGSYFPNNKNNNIFPCSRDGVDYTEMITITITITLVTVMPITIIITL